MKRQGLFTGRIYDEDYNTSDIRECCHQLSDIECADENKNQERHMNDLKHSCIGCNGCPASRGNNTMI